MKKILFVIPSLDAGGGEKALVNLLNILPINEYSIDLLLFKKQGVFLEQVPKNVQILSPEGDFPIFTQSLVESVKGLLKQKKWSLLWTRLQYAFSLKRYSKSSIAEQQSWKYWAKAMPVQDKEYDVAISFLEKSSIYYVVDKVKAKKKIGWIHTMYSESGLSADFDTKYFSQLSHLVTITKECKNNLEIYFPELKSISVIQNISSKLLIQQLSGKNVTLDKVLPIITTVGRLSQEKGIDLAIEAAKILLEKNIAFQWYFIGEGTMRNSLEQKILKYKLNGIVHLIGNQSNPYPFIKQATVYCQPSRYEGKSIALDEAKLLAKTIVVTNFDTVYDQIEHKKTGYIVEKTPEAIAEGLLLVINDIELRSYLETNLKSFSINQEEVVDAFKKLINE